MSQYTLLQHIEEIRRVNTSLCYFMMWLTHFSYHMGDEDLVSKYNVSEGGSKVYIRRPLFVAVALKVRLQAIWHPQSM